MRIVPATPADLPTLRAIYADARALQNERAPVAWPEFTDASIMAEISARQLFRVMDGDTVAGVFSVCYEDALIWGDLERGAHVYLHRIARVASHAGRGFLRTVLAWAWAECRALGRAGLRVDTWTNNAALVALYEREGFRVMEQRCIGVEPRLPTHYHHTNVTLLEALAPSTSAN